MLNSLEQTLERIEGKLDQLLARKKPAQAAKRKSKAEAHEAAVEHADYGEQTLLWLDAWHYWCDRRKEDGLYMTALAIKGALNKIGKFSEAAQIEALQAAAVKPWADVYPKEGSEVPKDDWFNKEDK